MLTEFLTEKMTFSNSGGFCNCPVWEDDPAKMASFRAAMDAEGKCNIHHIISANPTNATLFELLNVHLRFEILGDDLFDILADILDRFPAGGMPDSRDITPRLRSARTSSRNDIDFDKTLRNNAKRSFPKGFDPSVDVPKNAFAWAAHQAMACMVEVKHGGDPHTAAVFALSTARALARQIGVVENDEYQWVINNILARYEAAGLA